MISVSVNNKWINVLLKYKSLFCKRTQQSVLSANDSAN